MKQATLIDVLNESEKEIIYKTVINLNIPLRELRAIDLYEISFSILKTKFGQNIILKEQINLVSFAWEELTQRTINKNLSIF